MSDQPAQFVSFYSYKGGVGRSTVLANLACRQAVQGSKVLIIDLDLEVPGQHSSRLFSNNPIADSVIKGGFVDLCAAWQQHHEKAGDQVYEWDLRDYMLRSTFPDQLFGADKGEIFLMPAARRPDTGYAEKLGRLDWHKFFSPSIKGYQLLAALQLFCKIEEFDWVFLDSRTGLSDPYYMTTSWLSNTVVCFSTLSRQSIEGCRYAMERIMTEDSIHKYGEKRVLPVATLIPPTRNFEANNRIKAILANEWPEIDNRFVTEFRYDDALALEEKILVAEDGWESSDFGKSLQELAAALETRDSYLISQERMRQRFGERTLKNPFPNLRIEYWSPPEVASHYSVIYPEIEEQLTAFQPVIVYGSRGTGKTTMARYFDYQAQLIVFREKYQRTPTPRELRYLGLWIRQDSDFLKAFNVSDEDKQKNYSALFGLFFDMVVLRKALQAMEETGGLAGWVKSTTRLFRILRREIGVEVNENCGMEGFLEHLETRLYEIRAYINNPNCIKIPYLFQSNTLMKLLAEQLKERENFHFVVFVDEVENYASHQQQMLNTRVKNVKESDSVTYKLLTRNDGTKTTFTDADDQELEVTHDYRACYLDEGIGFDEFRKRAETLVNRYVSHSVQFRHLGKAQDFLGHLTPQEEARIICGSRGNKPLVKHLGEQHSLEADHALIQWMQKEPSLLRQTVAVVIVNQGKGADTVARNMHANTSTAQDWYHNYSRGALYWLCTLYRKGKTYSGFNDIAGIAGGNIRVVVDIFYSIFAEWIKETEEKGKQQPFSYQLQNRCIHELSETWFRKLDRFRPTEHRLNRLIERLGNLFSAIHKSPSQGEPEINHFSTNGELDAGTLKYLKICLRENLLRWLPSNKQKSSSDYLPDAFQLNPCFAPHFGISWRRKKKLTLAPDDVRMLCSGTDEGWKRTHSRVERQYHNERHSDHSQMTLTV